MAVDRKLAGRPERRPSPLGRRAAAALACALTVLLCTLLPSRARGDEVDPSDSVFELFTYTRDGKGIARGTAFFIDATGLALTNSHVVYKAAHDPDHYVALAVIGREFYSVQIVCASPLEVDPFEVSRGPIARDVAEIRLAEPDVSFSAWGILPGGGAHILARAHVGPLPAFPVLPLADAPHEQGQIRVIGYGRSAQPMEKTVSNGTVTRTAVARDGTPVFEIHADDRPERGSSGSPVLDEQNRVVGMYTWNDIEDSLIGIAISSAALAHVCP
jgi:hypothetical protein